MVSVSTIINHGLKHDIGPSWCKVKDMQYNYKVIIYREKDRVQKCEGLQIKVTSMDDYGSSSLRLYLLRGFGCRQDQILYRYPWYKTKSYLFGEITTRMEPIKWLLDPKEFFHSPEFKTQRRSYMSKHFG